MLQREDRNKNNLQDCPELLWLGVKSKATMTNTNISFNYYPLSLRKGETKPACYFHPHTLGSRQSGRKIPELSSLNGPVAEPYIIGHPQGPQEGI